LSPLSGNNQRLFIFIKEMFPFQYAIDFSKNHKPLIFVRFNLSRSEYGTKYGYGYGLKIQMWIHIHIWICLDTDMDMEYGHIPYYLPPRIALLDSNRRKGDQKNTKKN